MWSRQLSALLSAFLWSTQAFFVPPSGTSEGNVRFRSQGHAAVQQPSARCNSCSSRAVTTTAPIFQQQLRQRKPTAASMTSENTGGGGCDRKAFLSEITRAAGGAVFAAAAVAPKVAQAKEAVEAPVNWSVEFGEVKKATDAVLSELRGLTSKGEWAQLMEQAKGYDQTIRKGLMGDVRKKMPKDVKGDAMTYRNNITFDLIAINKAARAEDKSRALEVLDILEADIREFLNLEKRI